MHQNIAVILWQFLYGKDCFIIFVPGFVGIRDELVLGGERLVGRRGRGAGEDFRPHSGETFLTFTNKVSE